MAQKHIAASGASAGQWVACGAKIQCRNRGLHVDSAEIAKIAKDLGKKVSEVTLSDVQNPAGAKVAAQVLADKRKNNVILQPESPKDLPEPFSPHSQLTKSVYNSSLPKEEEITVEYYVNEINEIVSLMKKDPRWPQAEKEAKSIMEKMKVREKLDKKQGVFFSEYGEFFVGDFELHDSDAHNVVDLFSSSWSMGSSMDNGIKVAFGHALYDNFDMGKSDFKASWKSQELYSQNRTFFKLAVEGIYNHTQTKLTEKTYRLARLTDKGNLRPLSSFTGLHKVINDFNAENIEYTNENTVVLYADVPKERIFGFYGNAMGTAYQSEFMVLGAGRKLPSLQNYSSVKMSSAKRITRQPTAVQTKEPVRTIDDIVKNFGAPVVDDTPKKNKGFFARLFGL